MRKINLIKSLFLPISVLTLSAPIIILSNTGCGIPEKTIWAKAQGDFQVGVEDSGSITIYGKNGVNLSLVTISSFPVAGLVCDTGTVVGVTKIFTISGTPTQTYNDNISISGDGVKCSVAIEVIAANEYFPDGSNWVGHLSGSINYSFDTESNICHITGNNNYGADDTFVIPTSVTHSGIQYAVSIIDDYAFYQNNGITAINFNGITEIGQYAFKECDQLANVNLTNVSSIKTGAFFGCELESIEINGANSTYKLSGISTKGFIQKKNDITTITPTCGTLGGIACGNITIPSGITTIGNYAFQDCHGITGVDFSNTTTIGTSAFERCINLSAVDITNVNSLGLNWCQNCFSLNSVTIGSGTYTTAITGWANVGPSNCTLYAPSSAAGNTFKTDIIGEPYADKWTVSVNS